MSLLTHRINSDYILELNRFCDADKDIANCRQKLHDEVFRHDWFVALFNEGAPFYQLPLFNKPYFKEALRRFYLKAHDFITRFGFVGYYHVKDIEAWIEHVGHPVIQEEAEEGELVIVDEGDQALVFLESEKQLELNILETFPFGIIPVGITSNQRYGQYVLIENRDTMQQNIVFECQDEGLCERYDFSVMDRGAVFVPASYVYEHGICIHAPQADLVPVSSFADLYRQKRLIREAETGLFDANSMHIYPESFIIDRTPKDAMLDDVGDDTLYSLNSILGARQADNVEREAVGLERTRQHMQRIAMKRTVASMKGRCSSQQLQAPSTVIWEHKLEHNRPSVYEAMRYIPRSVEITGGKSGAPVVDVDKRIRQYENDVCTVMKMPYVFFKPHSLAMDASTGASKQGIASLGKAKHNDLYQKLLEKEVSQQHRLFDELFREIYGHTFARLDRQIFDGSFLLALEPGIHFDQILVRSDEELVNLVKYYRDIVPPNEIQRLVYMNFGIALPPELEVERVTKKRRYVSPVAVLDDVDVIVDDEVDNKSILSL